MQITHLLARKVAARLSAVIAGSTVGALVDAVAGDLPLVTGSTAILRSHSLLMTYQHWHQPQPSLNHSHYHPKSTIHAWHHAAAFVFPQGDLTCLVRLLTFAYLIYLGISAGHQGRTAWLCSLIFSRPLTSCNGMFYWTLTDSWASRIQASRHAIATRQYCRCAPEPYVTKMSLYKIVT